MARPSHSTNRSAIGVNPATQEAQSPETPRAAPDHSVADNALTIHLPARPDAAGPLAPLGIAELPAELMALKGMLDVPDILSMRSVNKKINESLETAVDSVPLQQVFADQRLQHEDWQAARSDSIQSNMKLVMRAVRRTREVRSVETELTQETDAIKAGLARKDPKDTVEWLKRAVRVADRRGQYDQSALALELMEKLLVERGPSSKERATAQCQRVMRFLFLGRAELARNLCEELITTRGVDPNVLDVARYWKIAALLLVGGPDAVNEACTVLRQTPGSHALYWAMAQHSSAQLAEEARLVVLQGGPGPVTGQGDVATLHFWKGETEAGLRSVEGLAEKHVMLHWVVDQLQPAERERIRNDPRWQSHEDAIKLFPELAGKPVDFGLDKLVTPDRSR